MDRLRWENFPAVAISNYYDVGTIYHIRKTPGDPPTALTHNRENAEMDAALYGMAFIVKMPSRIIQQKELGSSIVRFSTILQTILLDKVAWCSVPPFSSFYSFSAPIVVQRKTI